MSSSTHLKFYKNRCIITTETVSLCFLSDYFLLCPPHIVTILLSSAGPWKTWRPGSQVQVTPCIFAWLTILATPVHLSIATTWALEQGWSLRTVGFHWRSVTERGFMFCICQSLGKWCFYADCQHRKKMCFSFLFLYMSLEICVVQTFKT